MARRVWGERTMVDGGSPQLVSNMALRRACANPLCRFVRSTRGSVRLALDALGLGHLSTPLDRSSGPGESQGAYAHP